MISVCNYRIGFVYKIERLDIYSREYYKNLTKYGEHKWLDYLCVNLGKTEPEHEILSIKPLVRKPIRMLQYGIVISSDGIDYQIDPRFTAIEQKKLSKKELYSWLSACPREAGRDKIKSLILNYTLDSLDFSGFQLHI